jgi:cytoskeletal protein CcmA (bactofilin family)
MFNRKKKLGSQVSAATTLISKETEVVGDVKFSGTLDVEGIIRGDVIAQSGKDAVVRVIDKGVIEGNIRVPSVMINGSVIGDVFSSKHLELASRAQVQGNVYYAQVEMAVGAEVNGSLKHTVECVLKPDRKPQLASSTAEPLAQVESAQLKS